MSLTQIQKKIVEVAYSYVGEKETAGNSGFVNKKFLQEMQAIGWQKGWAWCACFAELVWSNAYGSLPQFPEKLQEVKKLITPSAVATWNNFLALHLTSTNPEPGSLVVWRQGLSWSGHIGIVTKVGLDKNLFQTVEGNTNAAGGREGEVVAIKERRLLFTNSKSGLNLMGFVHPI